MNTLNFNINENKFEYYRYFVIFDEVNSLAVILYKRLGLILITYDKKNHIAVCAIPTFYGYRCERFTTYYSHPIYGRK